MTFRINIYPNPNHGELTLIAPEHGAYSIVNSIGQTISVQGLVDGIYYMAGKSAKAKIVVSK